MCNYYFRLHGYVYEVEPYEVKLPVSGQQKKLLIVVVCVVSDLTDLSVLLLKGNRKF